MKGKLTSYELEETVAQLLLKFCNGKEPSRADLNNFLTSRGFEPFRPNTSIKIIEICGRILVLEKDGGKLFYKGYAIEKEKEPWALKYGWKIKYYRDEYILHAKTIEDARSDIDERTVRSVYDHEG